MGRGYPLGRALVPAMTRGGAAAATRLGSRAISVPLGGALPRFPRVPPPSIPAVVGGVVAAVGYGLFNSWQNGESDAAKGPPTGRSNHTVPTPVLTRIEINPPCSIPNTIQGLRSDRTQTLLAPMAVTKSAQLAPPPAGYCA